jgi:hypothetical protein
MARLELVEQAGQVDLKPVLAGARKPLPVTGGCLITGRQTAQNSEGRLGVPGELGDARLGGARTVIGEPRSGGCLDVGVGGIAAPRPLAGAQRGQISRRDWHEAPR